MLHARFFSGATSKWWWQHGSWLWTRLAIWSWHCDHGNGRLRLLQEQPACASARLCAHRARVTWYVYRAGTYVVWQMTLVTITTHCHRHSWLQYYSLLTTRIQWWLDGGTTSSTLSRHQATTGFRWSIFVISKDWSHRSGGAEGNAVIRTAEAGDK